MQLTGQIALVTGGSRGIGRAICVRLAELGAKVIINYSSNEAAALETQTLCGGPERAMLAPFNVADSEAVTASINRLLEEHGQIDILVNNAGIAKDGLFLRMKDEDWATTMGVNLNGAFYCARAVTRSMMKKRHGRIINISSVVGEMGNVGQAHYVTSKAGLLGFTKALAQELASRGITVNAVTPGFIDTEMTGVLSAEVKEALLQKIPLGRMGRAEEIAGAVAFLAGPEASYITGQTIGINGGLYMPR